MATLQQVRRPRNVKPAHGTARLTLTINGVSYAVRPLAPDAGSGVSRAYRLRKADGTAYVVSQHAHGAHCECGDFCWRHDGINSLGCKHIRSLAAVGLIDVPAEADDHDHGDAWEGQL